ncbi:MAG: cell division protein ZapA [Deltaproteobacteria bacterium]|nr:cell division protein ZapA [Deltaproteobacteria bacterium]
MDKPVKIQIIDHEYLIRSNEDAQSVTKIAEYLNGKIKEANNENTGLSDKKAVILAALHIASDYFQLLKEHDDLIAQIHQRSKRLIYHIDALFE